MKPNYKITRYACYTVSISMAVVGNFPPLLFLTFRNLYGISYSLLGSLVVINFITQLGVDLLFSFFSHKLNISKLIRFTPLLTAAGLLAYALSPVIFPGAVYLGLVAGTLIYSAAAGLSDALSSPLIAAIPAENPDREMSKLHSAYAWGAVAIVIVSTLFLLLCGQESWQYLALLWMFVPVVAFLLFTRAEIPPLDTPGRTTSIRELLKNKDFLIFFFCIFFGGASECTMAQWSSSYIEGALNIPKVWGDVFGVAMFAAMLGIGRTIYSKIGKNIHRVLIFGSLGAMVCYLVAALSDIGVIGIAACAITGFCVSMLWPGSLIIASERFNKAGVLLFALMAAGGDLGASTGPQFMGLITDIVINSKSMAALAGNLGLSAEQLGMKIGLITAAILPLLGFLTFSLALRRKKTREAELVKSAAAVEVD